MADVLRGSIIGAVGYVEEVPPIGVLMVRVTGSGFV